MNKFKEKLKSIVTNRFFIANIIFTIIIFFAMRIPGINYPEVFLSLPYIFSGMIRNHYLNFFIVSLLNLNFWFAGLTSKNIIIKVLFIFGLPAYAYFSLYAYGMMFAY